MDKFVPVDDNLDQFKRREILPQKLTEFLTTNNFPSLIKRVSHFSFSSKTVAAETNEIEGVILKTEKEIKEAVQNLIKEKEISFYFKQNDLKEITEITLSKGNIVYCINLMGTIE